jgi:hypothetical protein
MKAIGFSGTFLDFCRITPLHHKRQHPHSLTHSWIWALLEKSPIVQLLKNFRAFYETRSFITVFTRALHWSLSRARSIQSTPSHPISLRSILILSNHLHLGLRSGLFSCGFPTNIPYAFLFSHCLYILYTVYIFCDCTMSEYVTTYEATDGPSSPQGDRWSVSVSNMPSAIWRLHRKARCSVKPAVDFLLGK